jgi:hypothetical protein
VLLPTILPPDTFKTDEVPLAFITAALELQENSPPVILTVPPDISITFFSVSVVLS